MIRMIVPSACHSVHKYIIYYTIVSHVTCKTGHVEWQHLPDLQPCQLSCRWIELGEIASTESSYRAGGPLEKIGKNDGQLYLALYF